MVLAALEKKSIKKFKSRKPRIGDKSMPKRAGIKPRKTLKYGSVILPNEAKGCV